MFLKRIEAGEVGTSPAPEKQTPEKKKW
jgi:hypothetical protein